MRFAVDGEDDVADSGGLGAGRCYASVAILGWAQEPEPCNDAKVNDVALARAEDGIIDAKCHLASIAVRSQGLQ